LAPCPLRPNALPRHGRSALRTETRVQAQERRAEAPRPAYNLAGYPPAVRDGYVDGCETAKESSLARKDARRIAGDPQYAMGWNDGFALCGKKK
jgi:hypothetical protein